jgi:flavodoxin
MKTLVVYDSVWGNTEKIAQAVGRALAAIGEVKVLRAGEAKPGDFAGNDLVIVGSATQKFTSLPAMKKLLRELPAGALPGVRVAAFDTRLEVAKQKSRLLKFLVKIFGYSAEKMSKTLVKKGGTEAIAPEGFFVDGTQGPLKAGELERAAAWAGSLPGWK